MQTDDWKVRFALSTVEPMRDYTFPYLASIVGAVDLHTGELIGSALRCDFGGRKCLVTAHHVLDNAVKNYQEFAISARQGTLPFQVRDATIICDREADLALYELPDEYFRSGDIADLPSWPSDRIDRSPERRPRDYLVLHGFPGVSSYSSRHLGGVVAKSLTYGAMEKIEDRPSDLRPFEFALYFDSRDIRSGIDTVDPLPNPYGLSGSPVWRIGGSGRRMSDWEPAWSSLVGIVTQWKQDDRILVATEAAKILELADKL